MTDKHEIGIMSNKDYATFTPPDKNLNTSPPPNDSTFNRTNMELKC